METVITALQEAREATQALRTADRSEKQRRLAILATELEKVLAFAEYVQDSGIEDGVPFK